MEWYEAVDYVKPHMVQIATPRGSGSGFFISSSTVSDICAIATAAHVVDQSYWWEEPIRLFHPSSGKTRILRVQERAIHVDYDMDTAAIIFSRSGLPLPSTPLAFIGQGDSLRVGNEVGWLGFPSVSQMDLCFFHGRISAWIPTCRQYLVDGVAINGVSGGPTFVNWDKPMLIGVVSAYIPNRSLGGTLPGLSIVRDVVQLQSLAATFRTVDEAARKQEPPRPPTTTDSTITALRRQV